MNVTDEIKTRLDLVNYIQSYVPLKKAGRSYKGRCPFHDDRTPSFVVFPETQSWRCFGACGDGGDIFTFAMKQGGWDFNQALEELAAQAGVELKQATPQGREAKKAAERMRGALNAAADFFHDALYNSPQATHLRGYVEERGLNDDTVQQFGLGYAPDSWDALRDTLLASGIELPDIVAAGLLVERDDGSTYDRFRDRLMIPIRDARGRIIGFGARALKPDAIPKYLNSPQSQLFDKSHVLFGLDAARRTIREEQTAVIVEGYMDVMQAHQAGFDNVVAQMGTALTEQQLKTLRRYASHLILALDSDIAGTQATMRGLDAARTALSQNVQPAFNARGMLSYESHLDADISVVLLPEGMDPDDLIRRSPDEWARLIEEAMPVAEYAIMTATQGRNLDDPRVKKKVVREVIPIIDDIADPVERDHYRQHVARLLKVNERVLMVSSAAATIKATIKSHRQPVEPPVTHTLDEEWTDTQTASPREAFCIAALIHQPNMLHKADRLIRQIGKWPERGDWSELSKQDFVNAEHRAIFLAWRTALTQVEREPLDHLHTTLDDTLLARLNLLMESLSSSFTNGDTKRVGIDTLRSLLELRLRRLISDSENFRYLMEEEHTNGDLTASAYQATIMTYIAARQSLQKLIANLSFTASAAPAEISSTQTAKSTGHS